jgi:hypothetical protein
MGPSIQSALASVWASYPTRPRAIIRNAWAFAAGTKAGTKLSETDESSEDANPVEQAETNGPDLERRG